MKKPIRTAILLLALAAFGLYHHFTSPAMVMRRVAQQTLDDLCDAVESQDRAKVSAALSDFTAEDAGINLEVNQYSYVRGYNPALVQYFFKPAFLTFIDNTLYSLQSWHAKARIEDFILSPDAKSARLTFGSQELADGVSYYSGAAVNMRFSASTHCEGTVILDGGKAVLKKLDCKTQLGSVPKPDDVSKLRDPLALQQFLTR